MTEPLQASGSRATSSIRAASRRSALRRSRSSTARPASNGSTCPTSSREITADHAARYDALYVNLPRVPAAAVARADCRLRVVARHGVGYDSVDVAGDDARRRHRHPHAELDAAAGRDHRADVRAGARRPADAEGPAHAHRPLARADGQHGHGPHRSHAGRGRRGPHRQGAAAHGAGVRPEAARRRSRTSMRSSSATSARARSTSTRCCASRTSSSSAACSNDETRHLIGAPQFARMKPTAYFVNVARGPIVDEAALIDALRGRPHRGRGARRVRAGAGRPRQSAARDGQRDRHAAFAVLDRRVLPQHGVDRPREHRRRARRPPARIRRQPRRPRASARARLARGMRVRERVAR